MINYVKEAERLLNARRNMERSVENLERRLSQLIKRGGPGNVSAIDLSKPFTSSTYTADTIGNCLDIVMTQKAIRETQEDIENIDIAIKQLDKRDSTLLRMWYIDGATKEEIAAELSYSSRSSVYDIKKSAVSAFALLYYGTPALVAT